jgi:molybdenum cofactor cytidylyltransferase
MKFGPVATRAAVGAYLAHSLQIAEGRRLRKGALLTNDDVAAIAAAGVPEIAVARLDPGDMHEDEAAREIAAALATGGIRADAAATGRVNLFATAAGLFHANRAAIDRINSIDAGITLATLPDLQAVSAGRMVATVKIIPYAVAGNAVAGARAAANGALALHAYKPRRVGVVQTQLPALKASAMDKTMRVLAGRLAASGSVVAGELRVAHDGPAVAAAIAQLLPTSDMAIVFGASAISDIADVIPQGVRLAGGRIEHFGMPVDPGNLLLVAEVSGKAVLGAPGCARSPAENGFDWVLARLIAGVPVRSADIAAMGVGGLLMEIGLRGLPREASPGRKIAAVILAAGSSRRMGANKLLATIGGKALVRHVAEAATRSGAAETIVVTGHERERIESELAGLKVRFVLNGEHASGMASSLKAGIAALPAAVAGAVVLLGDMPEVSVDMIDRLIAAAGDGSKIAIATHNGVRGNPVLWPRRFFAEFAALTGDEGARALIAEHGDEVVAVELGDAAARDIDTRAALAAAGGTIPGET